MSKTGSRQKKFAVSRENAANWVCRCWPPSQVLVILYRDLTLKFKDDIFTLLYQVLLYVKRSFIPAKCTCTSLYENSVYQKLTFYLIEFCSLSPVWWEWTIFSTCQAWTSSGDSSTHLGMHFIHTLLPHHVRNRTETVFKEMGPYDIELTICITSPSTPNGFPPQLQREWWGVGKVSPIGWAHFIIC